MIAAMQRLLPFLLLALSGPALAEPQAFRVLNRTGQEAIALHVMRAPHSGAIVGSRNVLFRPLPPEAIAALRVNERAGCRFDFRLILADGRDVELTDQDICANPVVVMQTAMPAPGGPSQGPTVATPRPGGTARVSSGTGFVVARQMVLTNLHVVRDCSRVTIRTADGRELPTRPGAAPDTRRDLALVAVQGDAGPPLRFRAGPVRRGEAVVTYGFPLAGLLSSGPTLTTGEVNALSGLRDNPLPFQISAPVQPGNSGGPLLDRQGHVLGVIVSKLNAAGIAARTGDIPQNVNFAVKGQEALDYLRDAGVAPLLADANARDRSAAEVGDVADRSTVMLRCER
jgi:serine protease Do